MTEGSEERGGMRVGVVIPNRNGGERLVEAPHALAKHDFGPHEVIVIDDFSTSGSLERGEQECVAFRVISYERNLGCAAACNARAEVPSGELTAFLSNGAVAEQAAWLRELVDPNDRSTEVACVDSKLYRRDSGHVLDRTGNAFTRGKSLARWRGYSASTREVS